LCVDPAAQTDGVDGGGDGVAAFIGRLPGTDTPIGGILAATRASLAAASSRPASPEEAP